MLLISQFDMGLKCNNAKVSSSIIAKHKKAVIFFRGKRYTLDKLCFSMSSDAIGHEFNINESALCIIIFYSFFLKIIYFKNFGYTGPSLLLLGFF